MNLKYRFFILITVCILLTLMITRMKSNSPSNETASLISDETFNFAVTINDEATTAEPEFVEEPERPAQFYRNDYLNHRVDMDLPIEEADEEIPVLVFRKPVRGEDNIMFIDTSCATDEEVDDDVTKELKLTYQQVCAVESAAKMNPKSKVYLCYTCPLNSRSLSISTELVRRLLDHTNVWVWHETMSSIFQDTPLEEFYKSGVLKRSKYEVVHTSDVLRLILLWKYGGIYLDLDFVVTHRLDVLGKNFAGAESKDFIASGAMGMSADGIGRKVADECVEELRVDYRPDHYGYNGPYLITRVLQRLCGTNKIHLMQEEACSGFQVLDVPVFYAVVEDDWKDFFTDRNTDHIMSRIKHSLAVHLWNARAMLENEPASRRTSKEMRPGSRQPIALLQQQFCPVVYGIIELANDILEIKKIQLNY